MLTNTKPKRQYYSRIIIFPEISSRISNVSKCIAYLERAIPGQTYFPSWPTPKRPNTSKLSSKKRFKLPPQTQKMLWSGKRRKQNG